MTDNTKAPLAIAAESYASNAHDDMHENGKDYAASHFNSVQAYVDFEFAGDAEDEVKRLAKEHNVSMEVARETLGTALADIHLGYLNEAFLDDFLAAMAKEDARDFVDAFYGEDGFDPSDYSNWAHADGEVRRRVEDAGFEVTSTDLSQYDDELGAAIAALVEEREMAEAA